MSDLPVLDLFIISLLILWSIYIIGKRLMRQLTQGEDDDSCDNCTLHNDVMNKTSKKRDFFQKYK